MPRVARAHNARSDVAACIKTGDRLLGAAHHAPVAIGDKAALGAVATSNDANGVERRHKQRTQAGIQRLRGGVTIVQSMYVTAAAEIVIATHAGHAVEVVDAGQFEPPRARWLLRGQKWCRTMPSMAADFQ